MGGKKDNILKHILSFVSHYLIYISLKTFVIFITIISFHGRSLISIGSIINTNLSLFIIIVDFGISCFILAIIWVTFISKPMIFFLGPG